MDNLTHSLVGALIGQAGLKRRTGLAMPALIIGANLPDVDAACFFWLDGVEHLAFRRGITHGPIALVLLPLILAGLLYGFDRWQAGRGQKRFARPVARLPVSFKWLFLLAFVGCLTHPALDWLNVYGIRLLEPFSSRWFYGDVLFIIDIWLWGLMGFATWWSLRQEKRGGSWRRTGRQALSIALVYIGVNGAITAKAEADLDDFVTDMTVIASPPPIAFWDREIILHVPNESATNAAPLIGEWNLVAGPIGRIVPIAAPLEPSDKAPTTEQRLSGEQVEAFLFWSRSPFIECGSGGSLLLRDARFYDPRARDRFTVALPDGACDGTGGRSE